MRRYHCRTSLVSHCGNTTWLDSYGQALLEFRL